MSIFDGIYISFELNLELEVICKHKLYVSYKFRHISRKKDYFSQHNFSIHKKVRNISSLKLKYLYPARLSKKISEKSGPSSLFNVSNIVGVNLLTRSRLVLSHFRE